MTPNSEIELIQWTVLLEAAGEPFEGKLAVAYVIVNRMKKAEKTAFDICWAPYQFSCWLDPLPTIAKKLNRETLLVVAECRRAAAGAYDTRIADSSLGATHYLNKTLTIQQAGKLPSWVDALTHTVDIGAHSFYK